MEDLRVKEGLRVFFDIADKGVDKILRLAATRADKDSIPAIDPPKDLLLRRKLLGIFFLHLL